MVRTVTSITYTRPTRAPLLDILTVPGGPKPLFYLLLPAMYDNCYHIDYIKVCRGVILPLCCFT